MTQAELVRMHGEGSERTVTFSPDHINATATARQIRRHLFQLMGRQGVGDESVESLVLDLQELGWISSAGLNELIAVNRQARNQGVRLVLSNVQRAVHEVFVLTRLERMFELSSTLENAGKS